MLIVRVRLFGTLEYNYKGTFEAKFTKDFNQMHFSKRLILKLRKKEEMAQKKELTLDMLQPSRYKPNDLEQMAEETKFTKSKEIRNSTG